MPIYDLTYRRASLTRRAHGAFGPVYRQTLRYAFRNRWTKGVFAAAWLPALVFFGVLYVQTSVMPEMGRDTPFTVNLVRGFSYFTLMGIEQVWLLILSAAIGAGMLAEDRRANALELYFARPLTRLEYLGGKFAGLSTVLFGVTGVPALVVWVFDVLVASDWSRLQETIDWPVRIAAFALVLSSVTAASVLAISAVSKRGLHGAVYFAILYLFSLPFSGALFGLTGNRSLLALGYQNSLNAVGRALFGGFPGHGDAPFAPALTVLVGIGVLSGVVAWTRTRPSEVVR